MTQSVTILQIAFRHVFCDLNCYLSAGPIRLVVVWRCILDLISIVVLEDEHLLVGLLVPGVSIWLLPEETVSKLKLKCFVSQPTEKCTVLVSFFWLSVYLIFTFASRVKWYHIRYSIYQNLLLLNW